MQNPLANEAALPQMAGAEGEESHEVGGWFAWLAARHLRRRELQRRSGQAARKAEVGTETERATRAVRQACAKCAVTGAASGAVTTAAELLTTHGGSFAALATIPAGALAIGGEMVLRAIVHLDLTCDLAEIFGVPFEGDDTAFWWLYALAFRTTDRAEHAEGCKDPGRGLVKRVIDLTGREVGAQVGAKLLGESVLRNIVPGAAIPTSAIANWVLTRRLGDTVRRAVRYHRAFRDAMQHMQHRCAAHLGLLAEGVWFLFTADGYLSPEETTTLAAFVRAFPPEQRAPLLGRFVEDDYDWFQRLAEIPEDLRDDFLHALEVAATVDKVVSLPERKILRGAARALGRAYDEARIGRMMKQFDEVGVLG